MKIVVKDMTQGYGSKVVLNSLSFEFESGKLTTVLGPNGSGKSTLIKTICNIKAPKSGDIFIDDRNINTISKKEFAKIVAYVPQSSTTFGNTSVYDTVLAGRRPYIDWSYSNQDISIAANAMREMHIDDLHALSISNLSGGQKQRVHIARALAQNSDFFILDEPTSALDLKHQIDTMNIMRKLTRTGSKGAVVALHDLNLALNYSDEVIVLKDSHIHSQGPPKEVITEKMIAEVYGVSAKIATDEHGTFVHPIQPVWDE